MRTRLLAFAAGSAALAGLTLAPAAGAASTGTAQVSILHAVPGLTVDVYANGKELLPNFTPGTLTDPQALPAGTYDLAVYPSSANGSGTPAIEAKGVKVPAGANVTVVAHLDASGNPVLTPYVNDTSAVPAGKARLTVRHDAAAPAVDVRAGGTPVFTNLANPGQATAQVPAGTVSADVVLAGTDTVAIGPADLNLGEGTSTVVYAWGSAKDNTLKLATQSIPVGGSAPGGVPAGQTGAAAQDGWGGTATTVSLAAGAVALLAAGGAVQARRRATSAR